MAQVMFKRGSSKDLPKTGLVQGAFYLTTDTDKLYICNDGNKLSLLNQVVHSVANIDALPEIADAAIGEFYYCLAENVLATKKAAAADEPWTQINADTDTKVSDVTTTTEVNSGIATVTTKVKSTTKTGDSAGELTGSFKIKGAGDNTITRDEDGAIVITGKNDNATYTLGTAEGGKIALKGAGTGATNTEITVKGAGDIAITSDAAGNLTVDGTALKNTIGQEIQNVTITSVKNEFAANGNFTTEINLQGKDDPIKASAIIPIIKLGTNATAYKFESGTATLPVYTKTEVDNKFKTADAMVYMGTVSKADDLLAEATVKRGWTYKVATAGSYAGVACKVGDLIIAKVDGTPTNDSTTWDVVPSGDDQTIVGDVSNTGITISDSAAGGGVLAGITLANGDCTTVAGTASGKVTTIKVNHAPVTEGTLAAGSTVDVTQPARGTAEFSAITGITRDAYGHITGTTVKKLTVVDTDTHHDVTAVATTATHSSSGAVITTTLTQDGVTRNVQTTLNVVSDNLTVTNGGTDGTTAKNTLKINLAWGNFV